MLISMKKGVTVIPARGGACLTSAAQGVVVLHRRAGAYTFRIVAPDTTKRAALKKDSGPYSRPVVGAKTLYIKNRPFCFHMAVHRPGVIRKA